MQRRGRTLRLAPSLLSADFGAIGDAVVRAEKAGADAFHLDVMDGHFVPNISFGPSLVRAVRARTSKPLDVHLMVQHPERHFAAFKDAGGDTLVFHLEADVEVSRAIDAVHTLGVGVGAAMKPDTPVERVLRWIDRLDQVMVMSVVPGFSGQTFRPEALPKVEEVDRRLAEAGSGADLSIDGGLTVETAGAAARAGATFFVCGNSVYAHGDVGENLARLRRAVEDGAAGAAR